MKVDRRRINRIQNLYQFERNQWAKMLHDDFGQSLAAIRSFAVGIKNTEDIDNEVSELASIIETTASDLYTHCYDLMLGLRSSLIQDNNLTENIRSCITHARLESHAVDLQLHSNIPSTNMGLIVDMFILRIFQDCLNIVLRLACAKNIFVNLESVKNTLCSDHKEINQCLHLQLRVEVNKKIPSLGLSERFIEVAHYASAFGGEFTIDSSIDTEFNLMLSVDITDFMEENIT